MRPRTIDLVHIVFDIDGVLADFEGGFLRAWTRRFPEHPPVPPDERRHFALLDDYPADQESMVREIYYAQGFFRDLEPIPGAIAAVNEIVAMGHDVRICSAPLTRYVYCVPEKYAWVERHFGEAFLPRLILAKDKTWVHGDVLIDDKPEVTGSRTPTWKHVIFDQPFNRGADGPRMNWSNWREVLGI